MAYELEFTASSFMRISTLEARRGRDDPGQHFPTVGKVINELKDLHVHRRNACAPLWRTDEDKARDTYASYGPKIAELRRKKLEVLESELQNVSARLSTSLKDGTFTWALTRGAVSGTRQTYKVGGQPDYFFPMKQLESNLKRAHRLAAPNRNRLVAQLRDALDGRLPRHVLRSDIASFYESIPHEKLLGMLSEHGGVSKTSFRLIQTLLDEWKSLASRDYGVPTGVGLSAYLGEVYARQIDVAFAGDPTVHFYGRYVDDIVIATREPGPLSDVEATLHDVVAKLGLSLNTSKSQTIAPIPTSGDSFDLASFDFLGYSISKRGGSVSIEMSKNTIARYKSRLKASFDRLTATPSPTAGHESLLLDRVRFLTGNTKLVNSKGRAVTGIFFNYSQLNNGARCLTALDKYLATLISTHSSTIHRSSVDRLNRASFVRGFKERTFHRFRPSDLVRIVAVWRG